MPVKVKKLKKIRIRKVRQVRARRQAPVRKPPITNVNIHFAGGSQHTGSVYIPNAGEHQVIPMASIQPTQAFVPSQKPVPAFQEIHTQTSVPAFHEIETQTPKLKVSSVGSQYEPEIHTLYEERKIDSTQNPMRVGGGGRVMPVEAKNFIDINRSAVREQARINREPVITPVHTRPQRGQGAGDGLSRLLLPALRNIAFDYGIDSVDTGGKKRTRVQLQEMIKNARK